MRIVCVSDTHEHERSLVIPPCDPLIHAGDISHGRKHEVKQVIFRREARADALEAYQAIAISRSERFRLDAYKPFNQTRLCVTFGRDER